MKILLAVFATVAVSSGFVIFAQSPECDTDWIYYQLTNSCYFQGDYLNFDAAEANCKSLGGHLASIHNAFENTFIQEMTESGEKQNSEGMTWIGLHFTNNRWEWTDGSDTSFVYWMKKMPEKPTKYPCTELLQDDYTHAKNVKGEWQNMDCGTKMRKYVCKKTPNY